MKKISLLLALVSLESFAAKFSLDKSHSEVGFEIKHLVISTVKGRFDKFDGSFDYDPETSKVTNVDVTIETSSINTNEKKRDEHLRSPDFFDSKKYPKMTFKSAGGKLSTDSTKEIPGTLKIRDMEKPVTLEVEYKGTVKDPWGNERMVFSAKTKINRKDFGLTWNKALEAGGVLVGDDVLIKIEVEALEVKPEPTTPKKGKK